MPTPLPPTWQRFEVDANTTFLPNHTAVQGANVMLTAHPSVPPARKVSLGRVAYEAYCEAVGGRAYNGDPLPTWEQQVERNPKIAEAWGAAGRAVITSVTTGA